MKIKLLIISLLIAIINLSACSNDNTNLLLRARLGDKWGYIDKTGKWIINPQFDGVDNFSYGLAVVKINQKRGYIDANGNVVIAPQFISADAFAKNGLACVAIGNTEDDLKYGFIDKTGAFLVEPQFEQAGSFEDNDIAPVSVDGNHWKYIDKQGNTIIDLDYDFQYEDGCGNFNENGIAVVRLNGLIGFIDRTGQFIVQPQLSGLGYKAKFYCDLIRFLSEDTDKYGYMDKNGKVIINPIFEEEWNFTENGLATVRLGKQYGFINTKGQFVINPQYEYVREFNGNLAAICQNKMYGIINETGKIILYPQFENMWLTKGVICVQEKGKWGIIDKQGNWIARPQFDAIL